MQGPKISIIVPIYNVEPYLRKCLDSIVGQTYRNLEIILVDDGSTDNCGAICDEYAARDGRIIVIHQLNGGLSKARNSGLDIASGSYLGFVDSDDWIELDMFEYLISNALSEDANICICGRYEEYLQHSRSRGWPRRELLTREDAMEGLLKNDLIQNFVWDKLWERKLFDNVRFPVGRTYEDIATVYHPFGKASKILCLPDAKYHYLQREASIVGNTSIKNRVNHYISAKQRYDELVGIWPQFRTLLEGQCIASAISIWCGYIYNPKEERKKYDEQLKQIALNVKTVYAENSDVMRNTNLGVAGRIVLHLLPHSMWWSFALAGIVSWIYKCRHGRFL